MSAPVGMSRDGSAKIVGDFPEGVAKLFLVGFGHGRLFVWGSRFTSVFFPKFLCRNHHGFVIANDHYACVCTDRDTSGTGNDNDLLAHASASTVDRKSCEGLTQRREDAKGSR
jgi:hypothetical protein